MNEAELTDLRRHKIGFVFQSFGLLPLLSAYENVEIALRIAGAGIRERGRRANELLELVGLTRRAHHRPYELSGSWLFRGIRAFGRCNGQAFAAQVERDGVWIRVAHNGRVQFHP